LQAKYNAFKRIDDCFYAPHSRHTEVRREDIEKVGEIDILSDSEEAGVYIMKTRGGRQVFVTGHSEYDQFTLKEEYERDLAKGLKIKMPKNYFPDDDRQNHRLLIGEGMQISFFQTGLTIMYTRKRV